MKRKLIFFPVITIIIFFIVFKFLEFKNEQKIKTSPIYQTVDEYFSTGYISEKIFCFI